MLIDWPQSGQDLVDRLCWECATSADCDGLVHDACVGAWACGANQCSWVCGGDTCVAEGGNVAVVPNAPPCCDRLVKIPCDTPDGDGVCQGCDGSSVCTSCGNAQCSLGENACNCPDDCTNTP